MALRVCLMSTPNDKNLFKEIYVEFKYYNGFAVSQKQKSIESLHKVFLANHRENKILEISTKSSESTGIKASAFNLRFLNTADGNQYPLENIFQSSKVFENGGPFKDLLLVHPRDAKRDERLKTSGKLRCFNLNNSIWELKPKTAFYDWIYISALNNNIELSREILSYDVFTDIEFNHEKSINCQARAAAIYVSLVKKNILDKALHDKDFFISTYKNTSNQISMFDN